MAEKKSAVALPVDAQSSIAARHAVLDDPDGTVSYEECGTYDHVRFGTSTAVVERNSVLLIPGVTHAGGQERARLSPAAHMPTDVLWYHAFLLLHRFDKPK